MAGDGVHLVDAGQVYSLAADALDGSLDGAVALAVADEQPAWHGETFHLAEAERMAHAQHGFFDAAGFAAVFHDEPPRQMEGFHITAVIEHEDASLAVSLGNFVDG